MGILTTQVERTGDMQGQPTYREYGTASFDAAARAEFVKYEHGRTVIRPLPRTIGLTAKAIDGRALPLRTLIGCGALAGPNTGGAGTVANCLQLGKTVVRPLAPRQPAGCAEAGKCIVSWERNFVQLVDA